MPGNVRRPGGSDHPHDPRRPGPGMPRHDPGKPAGDESVSDRNDDVPDIDPKSRAPVPDLPNLRRPKPVD